MKLAQVLRLDDSDENVFERAAQPGEWAISGGFAFSNWEEGDLVGQQRQAFTNGWMGLESFGRATFVVVTPISEEDYAALIDGLAIHFVEAWGAPGFEAARPVAEEELGHMREMCEDHDDNTLLIVERELVPAGLNEKFRAIVPGEAKIEDIAGHG
ncbi:DUF6505 family protein [Marimonas arenosa]|uniref:DUF6505 family protein n=1 Tax=Marimonas arenosa TaxID=1795305 RepID=A0AAE3WDA1_9RHOB|nr:DUF6505 family protein [Marimonas arenosa]MDQ2091141.1 DUF6505 family protein [Marimonas arenosa]